MVTKTTITMAVGSMTTMFTIIIMVVVLFTNSAGIYTTSEHWR